MNKFEFSRPVPVDRVIRNSLGETIIARDNELAAVASRLKIEAIHSLTGEFELRYVRELRTFEVEGTANARITQICVVSGDPFESAVVAQVRSRFTTDRSQLSSEPDSATEWDDLELIEDGVIDIGDLAVQHIALSLDPHPRKPGAEWPEMAEAEARLSPFVVLEGLKKS